MKRILLSMLIAVAAIFCTNNLFASEHHEPSQDHSQKANHEQEAVVKEKVAVESDKGWSYEEDNHGGGAGRGLASESKGKKEHSSHAEKLNDFPAEKAFDLIKNGNLRFVQGKLRKPMEGMNEKDRNRLMAGQSPHTIVLSCSDSRVPPEHIFDQRLGEIFVIRSAGEALDKAVLASIEYAVSHLGVQLIFVMGHESCGAVQAALQTMPNTSTGSPHIDYLVADIQPRVANYFRQPASSGVIRETTANARGVVRDLIQRSEIIKKRVAEGKLQVRSGIYHLDSGLVDFH